jgi:hypothetical protein
MSYCRASLTDQKHDQGSRAVHPFEGSGLNIGGHAGPGNEGHLTGPAGGGIDEREGGFVDRHETCHWHHRKVDHGCQGYQAGLLGAVRQHKCATTFRDSLIVGYWNGVLYGKICCRVFLTRKACRQLLMTPPHGKGFTADAHLLTPCNRSALRSTIENDGLQGEPCCYI